MNARLILVVLVALVVGFIAGTLTQTDSLSAIRLRIQAAETQRELYRQKAELLEQELAEIVAAVESE